MKSKLTTIVLASQLLGGCAGLYLLTPALATAQETAGQKKADRELMQKIRKAVVADKTLSTSAHNVKIVSHEGAVTLRGRVKSEEEKKAIEDKAAEIAGQGKVTSELTVASK
jgi:hyperosmotically inducible protein